MKRMLFVYNPRAGQGKVRKKLSDILDAFVAQGYLPAVYPTQAPGDATKLVRGIGRHYRRVVCCGGDGTLHEVIEALMELPDPPVLGYIPAGSTNDVSRNLDLPKNMRRAAEVAAGGETMRCDMGRFNGNPFVYVAAFGLFADVSYATSQKFKNLFGHMAYILEGVGRLGNIRSWEVTVEHDEGTLEGEFIFGMVGNTRSVGGFQNLPVPEVALDDGKFELLLVRKPKNPVELQGILTALMSQKTTPDGPVIGLRTARARFLCQQELEWTLDGECGGSHAQAEIQNIPRALELCCRQK